MLWQSPNTSRLFAILIVNKSGAHQAGSAGAGGGAGGGAARGTKPTSFTSPHVFIIPHSLPAFCSMLF